MLDTHNRIVWPTKCSQDVAWQTQHLLQPPHAISAKWPGTSSPQECVNSAGQMGGLKFLTDPQFSTMSSPVPFGNSMRRYVPPACTAGASQHLLLQLIACTGSSDPAVCTHATPTHDSHALAWACSAHQVRPTRSGFPSSSRKPRVDIAPRALLSHADKAPHAWETRADRCGLVLTARHARCRVMLTKRRRMHGRLMLTVADSC